MNKRINKRKICCILLVAYIIVLFSNLHCVFVIITLITRNNAKLSLLCIVTSYYKQTSLGLCVCVCVCVCERARACVRACVCSLPVVWRSSVCHTCAVSNAQLNSQRGRPSHSPSCSFTRGCSCVNVYALVPVSIVPTPLSLVTYNTVIQQQMTAMFVYACLTVLIFSVPPDSI